MTVGIVLTQANSLNAFLDNLRGAAVPCLKVVTQWGWPWDDHSRSTVLSSMPHVIVRTRAGDGTQGVQPVLDPTTVKNELAPWIAWNARLTVELGNEPNVDSRYCNTDMAYSWAWYMNQMIDIIRHDWPAVRIVAPGLVATPERNYATWNQVCAQAFNRCDAVGFHAYAWRDFVAGDKGEIERVIQTHRQYYAARPWIGTECGIHDPPTPDTEKCRRYATLRRNAPAHVEALYFYHYTDQPLDDDQRAYRITAGALPSLGCKGSIT